MDKLHACNSQINLYTDCQDVGDIELIKKASLNKRILDRQLSSPGIQFNFQCTCKAIQLGHASVKSNCYYGHTNVLFQGWQNEQEEKIESVTNGYVDDITFCKNELIELLASKDFETDR